MNSIFGARITKYSTKDDKKISLEGTITDAQSQTRYLRNVSVQVTHVKTKQVFTAETDEDGNYYLSVPTGKLSFSINLFGYSKLKKTLTFETSAQGGSLDFVLSKTIVEKDDLRIILTWQGEPKDLDTYLIAYDGELISVSDNNKKEEVGLCKMTMDRAARNGWGPITTSVQKFTMLGDEVQYLDFVVEKFNDNEPTTIGEAKCTCTIYTSTKRLTVKAPSETDSNYWHAFRIDTFKNKLEVVENGFWDKFPDTKRSQISKRIPLEQKEKQQKQKAAPASQVFYGGGNTSIFAPRLPKITNTRKKSRQLGPREIGRAKGFKPADYGLPPPSPGIFSLRLPKKSKYSTRTITINGILTDAQNENNLMDGCEIKVTHMLTKKVFQTFSEDDGYYKLSFPNGKIQLSITKFGYSRLKKTFRIDDSEAEGRMNWALSEKVESPNDLRIVLNWGAEPHDLDAKIQWESRGREYRVDYNHKKAQCGGCTATLDRDATEGWGPQTLTLRNFNELPDDVEHVDFVVHNFSKSLVSLGEANAVATIYSSQKRFTIKAPKNYDGAYWHAFRLDVNSKKLLIANLFSDEDPECDYSPIEKECKLVEKKRKKQTGPNPFHIITEDGFAPRLPKSKPRRRKSRALGPRDVRKHDDGWKPAKYDKTPKTSMSMSSQYGASSLFDTDDSWSRDPSSPKEKKKKAKRKKKAEPDDFGESFLKDMSEPVKIERKKKKTETKTRRNARTVSSDPWDKSYDLGSDSEDLSDLDEPIPNNPSVGKVLAKANDIIGLDEPEEEKKHGFSLSSMFGRKKKEKKKSTPKVEEEPKPIKRSKRKPESTRKSKPDPLQDEFETNRIKRKDKSSKRTPYQENFKTNNQKEGAIETKRMPSKSKEEKFETKKDLLEDDFGRKPIRKKKREPKKKSKDDFGSISSMLVNNELDQDDMWSGKHTIKRKSKQRPAGESSVSSYSSTSVSEKRSPKSSKRGKKKSAELSATALMFDSFAGTSNPIDTLDPKKKKKKRTPSYGKSKEKRTSKKGRDFGSVTFSGEDDLWANNSSQAIKRTPKKNRRQRNTQQVDFSDFKVSAPPEDDEDDFAGMGRVSFADAEPVKINDTNGSPTNIAEPGAAVDTEEESTVKKNRKRLPDFMMSEETFGYESVTAERNQSRSRARFAQEEKSSIPSSDRFQSRVISGSETSITSDYSDSDIVAPKKPKKKKRSSRGFLSIFG